MTELLTLDEALEHLEKHNVKLNRSQFPDGQYFLNEFYLKPATEAYRALILETPEERQKKRAEIESLGAVGGGLGGLVISSLLAAVPPAALSLVIAGALGGTQAGKLLAKGREDYCKEQLELLKLSGAHALVNEEMWRSHYQNGRWLWMEDPLDELTYSLERFPSTRMIQLTKTTGRLQMLHAPFDARIVLTNPRRFPQVSMYARGALTKGIERLLDVS